MTTPYHTSDLAIEDGGTLLVLASRTEQPAGFSLIRCSKYGEPLEHLALTGIPSEFDCFVPDSMQCGDGKIHLVDRNSMKAVVADRNGRFQAGYFITAEGSDDTVETHIERFLVNDDGTLAFTLSSASEPVVITVGKRSRPFLDCAHRRPGGLTLGVVAVIGVFVSSYLFR